MMCSPGPASEAYVRGAIDGECSSCGTGIVVSPSSLVIKETEHPNLQFLCPPCFMKHVDEEKAKGEEIKLQAPRPAQMVAALRQLADEEQIW